MKLLKPTLEMIMEGFFNEPVKYFSPASCLSQYIEVYWLGYNTCQEFHKVEPDGVVDIVVSTSKTVKVFCFGTATQVALAPLELGARYFGIRFRPGQTRHFFPMNVSHLTNGSVSMNEDFFKNLASLGSIENHNNVISQANHLLTAALMRQGHTHNKLDNLINYIIHQPSIQVRKLVEQEYVTQRTARRWFNEHIGISPKKFQSIIRINQIKDYLSSYNINSLSQLAYSSGFVDQSHLNKEFKHYFGVTPKAFKRLLINN
ncbi:DUF6597 domain-containing transcriptional factor [Aliikangiella sp. IMCC44359]|uniref:DUF6597 domain-containing transcriptional factor n=1 Tax=Aliikangiella sp. IMCC44359 TaxID=3459125 RepID=UPI00403A820F